MSTDLRAFRQRSGAVDFVAQLANITGPRVTDQARQGVVGEVQVWQVQFQAGIVGQLLAMGIRSAVRSRNGGEPRLTVDSR